MLQFIVLLTIMALWALTSLLSREAQPLPPRAVRGPGPDGPRPSSSLSRGDALGPARYLGTSDRLPAPSQERKPPAPWREASPTPRPGSTRGLGADDGIVILESESRSGRPLSGGVASSTGAANRRGTPSRRSTRSRSAASAPPPKPAEPGRARALTTLVTQSMAQRRNRPLEIAPLGAPMAPISSPLTQISTGAAIEHPGSPDSPPAFTSEGLRGMLANSTKLREVALLTELLQPPLALRRRRHGR
jgi:hypothetical protein